MPEFELARGRRSVCVFCGSRDGREPRDITLAQELGSLIGNSGHGLVYGGGGTGLMGRVARAASGAGAHVTGVTPRFMAEREGGDEAPVDEWVLTEDLFDRKRRMLALADAFVALPGGYGTLDEVLEVVSLTGLGLLAKPVVLLGADHRFWDQLDRLVESLASSGFAKTDRPLYRRAGSAREALEMIGPSSHDAG